MPKSAQIALAILLGIRGALYLWAAYRWEKDRQEALERLRRHHG